MHSSNPISKNNKKPIYIVVIGETGNGKSTLCNTLTGTNSFKESPEPECETKITSGLSGKFDIFDTFIIDTPGVGDPENRDSEHLTKMIQYVKSNPQVSVIILVFNCIHLRFTSNEKGYCNYSIIWLQELLFIVI